MQRKEFHQQLFLSTSVGKLFSDNVPFNLRIFALTMILPFLITVIVSFRKFPDTGYQSLRYSTNENLISLGFIASYKKFIQAKKNHHYNVHYEDIAAGKMQQFCQAKAFFLNRKR